MASIRRQGNCCEIRECRTTARGPRQFALLRFRGALTPEILERAAARATRPLRPEKLIERARVLGIPVMQKGFHPEARALLALLQRGEALDPVMVSLLVSALTDREARPLPPHLAEAAEWIWRDDVERGFALRGLLRSADRIRRSRAPLRTRPAPDFPRFRSDNGRLEASR